MKNRLFKLFATLVLVTSFATAQYKVPPPYLGPEKPEYVLTLVQGMSVPTLQPTLDTFMGRALAGYESSFSVSGIARGERSAFQDAADITRQGDMYCALATSYEPCKDGSAGSTIKKYVDLYISWVATQPISAYVQGGDPLTSLLGTPIIVPLPPPPPVLNLVSMCYETGGIPPVMCYAPGASTAGYKNGDRVNQDGKVYVIKSRKVGVGVAFWAEPEGN